MDQMYMKEKPILLIVGNGSANGNLNVCKLIV